MEGVDQPLQILNPRNPGESLKVAETVLRKRNRDLKGQAERAQKRIDVKKEAARQRIDLGVVTPEKLVKDGLVKQLDSKRIARLRNQNQKPRVKFHDRSASLFVVRNARQPPSKASQAVLRSLGLTKQYSATFVPNASSELLKLRTVQPFVFYGYLNTYLLLDLFKKHLRFKHVPKEVSDSERAEREDGDEERKEDSFAVADNFTVEDRLGHIGMLCIEDIVDAVRKVLPSVDFFCQIKSCSPHFYEVMSHVSAFRLGSVAKAEGVDANVIESGDIGFKINAKVSKLL